MYDMWAAPNAKMAYFNTVRVTSDVRIMSPITAINKNASFHEVCLFKNLSDIWYNSFEKSIFSKYRLIYEFHVQKSLNNPKTQAKTNNSVCKIIHRA